jgi:hypothetical protein
MKAAAAVLMCVGLGLLAADALADPVAVPVPTVPTVTVPTLPVPVPTVPVPTVPVPTVPVPPPPSTTVPAVTTAPSAPSLPATTLPGATSPSATPSGTPGQSVPIQSSVLGTTGSGGGSTPSSTSSTSSSGSSGPQVKHFNSSWPWISTTGKKNRRSAVLTFVLKRPTRVVFTVEQLAPDCQTVGRFSVRGRAGVNRVRFSGRVGRQKLDAGTYRITARTVNGRALQRVTIVVVDRAAPTKAELAALRAANVCSTTGGTATAAGSTGASNTGWLSGTTDVGEAQPSAGAPTTAGSNGALGGVLGSATVEKTARAIRPALVALLAAAILLLGLASLPRVVFADARVNEALARHRTEITAVGAVALVAVVFTFLFG